MRQPHLIEEGFPAWIGVEIGKQRIDQHFIQSAVARVVCPLQPVEGATDVAAVGIGQGYLIGRFHVPIFNQLLKCSV